MAERSVRGAARRLGRPPATVAAAIDRLEGALATRIVHRAGASLSATLEGERLAGPLAALAGLAAAMMAAGREPVATADRAELDEGAAPTAAAVLSRTGDDGEADDRARAAARPVSLVALARFCAVVRAGSIRRGAQYLAVGQPQLTRQIAHLEASLATPLLTRAAAGCEPTPAGRRLFEIADEIDRRWAALSAASQGRFRRSAATVRLGSVIPLGYESRVAGLLAALLARWHAVSRRHHLFLSSTTAEELMDGLKTGRFDVAVIDTDVLPDGVEGRLLTTAALAVVGRRGSLAGRGAGAILAGEPVALPSVRSGLRQKVAGLLGALPGGDGATPANFVEVDSIPVIVNMVIDHGYVSVLPLESATNLAAALDILPLPPEAALSLWLAWQPTGVARRAGEEIFAIVEGLLRADGATDPAASPGAAARGGAAAHDGAAGR